MDGAVVPSGHRTLPMVTVALSISASGGACQEISSGVQCVVQGAIFSPDICPAVAGSIIMELVTVTMCLVTGVPSC